MSHHPFRSHSRQHPLLQRTPLRPRRSWLPRHLVLVALLSLLLCSNLLSDWSFLARPADAAGLGTLGILPSASSKMTFQQFLQEGRQEKVSHGRQPSSSKPPAGPQPQHTTNYAKLLPSAEPATMKPLTQALSTSYFRGGSANASLLDLVGSDGRLEVQLQPATFDISHATVPGGTKPSGALSLRITELQGYYVGQSVSLGSYQLQLVDRQGRMLSGVQVLQPMTLLYHYQPAELEALGLDPGRITLTIPALIAAAIKAKNSTRRL
jgi:hypothetical protein